MMSWLLAAALCVALVELVLRLPIVTVGQRAASIGQRAGRVLRAPRVSDHWKEKALLAYARRLMGNTLLLTALLLVIVLVAVALVALGDRIVPGFAAFVMGWQGILATLVLATAYALLRARLPVRSADAGSAGTPYSALHHLALGNGMVAEMTFDIDQALARPDAARAGEGQHVFVAGLARAGTTILMRRFHATGAFRSLTYRDMPFVLAPNLWRRLSRLSRRDIARVERAHGDGVAVDADSPESFDEVFWRVFDGPGYLLADRLVPHAPDPELAERYRAYVGAILAGSGCDRYLSKNNNNLLRLGFLAGTFPRALILVPFRDPLAHAASLRGQHRTFAEAGSDPFVRQYMDYLSHHEFGPGHRPFRPGPEPAAPAAAPDSLDYWLGMWIDVYGWLLETAPAGARFVSYEALCRDPGVWADLDRAAGLDGAAPAGEVFETRLRPVPEGANPDLAARAQAIHDRLLVRAGRAGERRLAAG